MNIFYTIVTILAGLGVSLYGFKVLRDGMETSLGSGFKKVIGKVANNRWGSYFLSAGVTGAWQSTTLTLSMISSFLNVGNITLSQGIALMLGVQLGSALAIVLVAFQAIDLIKILSILCVVGAFMLMFSRHNYKMQKISTSVMGFGLLFAGISMLGEGVGVLVNDPSVYDTISVMTNPVVLILVGAALSMITNSMYATVTIITALVGVSGAGPLSMMSGVFMLIGAAAVGGVVPLLYCINNSSRETKAMLLGYNVFKVMAATLFGLCCFIPWLEPFYNMLGQQSGIFYVLLYIIMMFVPGVLMLLINNAFGKLLIKIVPNKRKSNSIYDSFVPDENSLKVFSVALPYLINDVSKIINIQTKLMTKIMARYQEKTFNDKGLQSEIKGLDKIIKLTTNTTIRLTAKFNKKEQDKLNVVINILNDVNHYLERIQKLYDYGMRFKVKQRKLSAAQVGLLTDLWNNIAQMSGLLNQLIQNATNNNIVIDDKLFNKVLAQSQSNDEQNAIARKEAFVPQQKVSGDYVTYFDVLLAFENINTDLSNITIKLGILSN